jgi:hypothetical protein
MKQRTPVQHDMNLGEADEGEADGPSETKTKTATARRERGALKRIEGEG